MVSSPLPHPLPIDVLTAYPSLIDVPCRYPDARPAGSRRPSVYHRGVMYALHTDGPGPEPLVDTGEEEIDLTVWLDAVNAIPMAERVPVIALGSNAYPRQLWDKFLRAPVEDDTIPTIACTLRDARTAYCASLSGPGYVPVTLEYAPGHTLHAWVQWLTAEQLTLIAQTEGSRYALVECGDGQACSVDAPGLTADRVFAWLHETRLDLGTGPIRFPGIGLIDAPLDPDGVTEADLLHELLARVLRETGATLTWDGCRLPPEQQEPLRSYLDRCAALNPIPPAWVVVDRTAPDFADQLRRS